MKDVDFVQELKSRNIVSRLSDDGECLFVESPLLLTELKIQISTMKDLIQFHHKNSVIDTLVEMINDEIRHSLGG